MSTDWIHTPTHTWLVRPYQPEDLMAVLEVYRQCEDFLALGPVPTASLEMVQADLALSQREGGRFCVIASPQGGPLAGVIDYIPSGWEGDPHAAFLELLMIAAPYRSGGLGAAVVAWVEGQIARDPAITIIHSGVQVNNPGAIRFWQRMGYAIVSDARDLPDGTTAYALEKHLS